MPLQRQRPHPALPFGRDCQSLAGVAALGQCLATQQRLGISAPGLHRKRRALSAAEAQRLQVETSTPYAEIFLVAREHL